MFKSNSVKQRHLLVEFQMEAAFLWLSVAPLKFAVSLSRGNGEEWRKVMWEGYDWAFCVIHSLILCLHNPGNTLKCYLQIAAPLRVPSLGIVEKAPYLSRIVVYTCTLSHTSRPPLVWKNKFLKWIILLLSIISLIYSFIVSHKVNKICHSWGIPPTSDPFTVCFSDLINYLEGKMGQTRFKMQRVWTPEMKRKFPTNII